MRHDDAVALLRRLHTAQNHFYAGGDSAGLRDVLVDDVSWHVPGRNAIAGNYHGITEVLDYFRHRRELADRSFRLHPGDVLSGEGDRIASVTDGTALIGGVHRDWSTVGLYQVRERRIAACWLLPLDPRAFDAAWASRATLDSGPVSVSTQRVRPRHCDAQGMLHASRYYEYFEDAFLDWLDEHTDGYAALRQTGVDLVIVSSSCEHHHGAQLDDLLAVEVRPSGVGRASLSVSFTVRHADQRTLAVGRTTYVAVAEDTAVPLPHSVRTAANLAPSQ